MPLNEHGQDVGDPVPGWAPVGPVAPLSMTGRTAGLAPLGPEHHQGLWRALVEESPAQTWTYLPYGPFEDRATFEAHLERLRALPLVPLVVLDEAGREVGVATYLRDDPANGCVEVGHLAFSAALQRTTTATEAMFLMARHVFEDLGYRRYEWKCDDRNRPSRAAAERLGFTYEGTFRQAVVVKGRNRDTAWFSITDGEWRALRPAFDRWLDPGNFDEEGVQRAALAAATMRDGRLG